MALEHAGLLAALEQWAAASGAVIAVVPARRDDETLVAALEERAYVIASEWYEGSLASK